MDPASAVVAAIAGGATAALKDTTTQVVKDAYAGLKAIITRKFTTVDVDIVEKRPDSEDRQRALTAEIKEAGADRDEEVLAKVDELLQALKTNPPQDGSGAPLIDLQHFEAASFTIREAVRDRQMVHAKETKIGGKFEVQFSTPEGTLKNC